MFATQVNAWYIIFGSSQFGESKIDIGSPIFAHF